MGALQLRRAGMVVLLLLFAGEALAQSAFDERIELESMLRDNPFAITPHKPTYIIPFAYNDNPNIRSDNGVDGDSDYTEIKFQVSLKVPLLGDPTQPWGSLSAAYTQQAYWQAYNGLVSSPFRETNHEPELFWSVPIAGRLLGFEARQARLGISHQSNGRSGVLSRSWNRVYAQLIAEQGDWYLSFKPWWRIPEDTANDDNPDIEDYLGHFELTGLYRWSDQTYGVMLRNNLHSQNHGAVQVEWTFPLLDGPLRGYVQYFNGYGESLIDYDHYSNRIGVGLMLVNWL